MSNNSGGMIPRGRDINATEEERLHAPNGRPASEQPRWRQDFPIDWDRDDYVSRRELTKFIVLTSAAFTVGQLVVGARWSLRQKKAPPAAEPIALADELPVGGAKTFIYPPGSTPRLLVRATETNFVAYDQACTHLMCPVVPAVKEGKLHCPCHNGWFDLQTGEVLAGPPQRALPKVFVELRDGKVWATGVSETPS